MQRRGFIGALLALPFVGKVTSLFAAPAAEAVLPAVATTGPASGTLMWILEYETRDRDGWRTKTEKVNGTAESVYFWLPPGACIKSLTCSACIDPRATTITVNGCEF